MTVIQYEHGLKKEKENYVTEMETHIANLNLKSKKLFMKQQCADYLLYCFLKQNKRIQNEMKHGNFENQNKIFIGKVFHIEYAFGIQDAIDPKHRKAMKKEKLHTYENIISNTKLETLTKNNPERLNNLAHIIKKIEDCKNINEDSYISSSCSNDDSDQNRDENEVFT